MATVEVEGNWEINGAFQNSFLTNVKLLRGRFKRIINRKGRHERSGLFNQLYIRRKKEKERKKERVDDANFNKMLPHRKQN